MEKSPPTALDPPGPRPLGELYTVGLTPKLRGIPDVIAAVLAVPAAVLLVGRATPGDARFGAIVYSVTLLFLFVMSAVYHAPRWPMGTRRLLRKFDHWAIYVFNGGCYTPIALLLLPRDDAHTLLGVVWATVLLGFVKSFLWERSPAWFNTLIYVLIGWLIFPYLGALRASSGPTTFTYWWVGALLYVLGAIVYVRRRPNPAPMVFGYHELFHVFVIAAAAVHYVGIWRICTGMR